MDRFIAHSLAPSLGGLAIARVSFDAAAYATGTTPSLVGAPAAGQLVLHGRPYEHARRLMMGSMPADVQREPDQRGDLGGAPLPHGDGV
jgi:hypothetical protein